MKVESRVALLALAFLAACSSHAPAAPVDAGAADADEEAGVPCEGAGISKGPWVLHVDGAGAVVRWEACRPGTAAGMTYAALGGAGGGKAHAASTETPFVVDKTIRVLNADASPDFAGTWYMHEAKLSGLSPATCYAYGLDADASIKGRFCTARKAGDVVRFLAIGDTNPCLGDTTSEVLSHVVPMGFDFTVHGGDIEYYDSIVETYQCWFQKMAPLLRAGAMMPAVGNHDGDTQSGEPSDKWEQYTQRFWGGAGFDGTDQYYAFSSGGIWLMTLDTEQPVDPASVQYQWLANELAKAAASPGYRFSILYVHRPFLTCGDTGDDVAGLMGMQPLFAKYKVPLVLQAHMHGYERFETQNAGVPLTLVTAAGGGGLIQNVNANTSRSYCNERVASGPWYHGVVFEVDASPSSMIKATVVDQTGAVRDSFAHAVP